jgi:choline dehydrogenase-like flavoprotein
MILDFVSGETPAEFASDLCLIGAGAVGIAMGLEFAGTRSRVLVLEGGGERSEPDTQRLYDSELRGLRCTTAVSGRARIFGGTTTMWAGQALPLDDGDFERREWVDHSGWPVSLAQLLSYYRRAERLMGLPEAFYDERDWPAALPRPPLIEGTRRRFSTFTATPNFAAAHRAALAAADNLTVLLHANATRLVMSGDGSRVDGIEIRSLAGRTGRVRARRYVICCGGVETPRLLLASNGQGCRGVANEHDLVGRFFQEHVNVGVPVLAADRRRMARLFHGRRLAGVRYYAKLTASVELQQRERLVNVGSHVNYARVETVAERAVKELGGALRRDWRDADARRALAAALRHPGQLASACCGRAMVRHARSLDAACAALRVRQVPLYALQGFGAMYVCVQTETVPRRVSRVTLDRRADSLGMARPIVDWRVGEAELRTAEVFARRLDALLRRHGLGYLDLSSFPLSRDLDRLSERVGGGCHHMGTTRMSNNPRTGVVDRDCRVHGVQNLFVAGSAVFPTSGWSNPTLTLLALGLRLADRLRRELGASPPVVGLSCEHQAVAHR